MCHTYAQMRIRTTARLIAVLLLALAASGSAGAGFVAPPAARGTAHHLRRAELPFGRTSQTVARVHAARRPRVERAANDSLPQSPQFARRLFQRPPPSFLPNRG